MNVQEWTAVLKDSRLNVDIEYQVPHEFKYELKARDPATVEYARHNGVLLPLDNGGRPFLITLHKSFLRVYSKHIEPTWDTTQLLQYSRPISNMKNLVLMTEMPLYETDIVFIGDGSYESSVHGDVDNVGNSVLVARENCWNTIISQSVEDFKTSEPVVDFKSTVCNSSVPYGFAFTKHFLVSIGPIGCFGYYEQPKTCAILDDTSHMVCRYGIHWKKKDIDHITIVPRI